jgi:site-specific recombinase XerD
MEEEKEGIERYQGTLHRTQVIDESIKASISVALRHTRAPSTLDAYYGELARFVTWCAEHSLNPSPALPETVAGYIAQLAEKGYAKSTISRTLTVIRLAHDKEDPTDNKLVREVWKGIKRKYRRKKKQARIITLSDLRLMVGALKREKNPRATRDRAMLAVGWAGALRSCEIVALNWSDIEHVLENDLQHLLICIKDSKTDQIGEGKLLGLPQYRPELADICPVRAINDLFTIRVNFVEDSPVFHSSYFGENRNTLNPFSRASSRAITRAAQRAAKAAKIPHHYSSHSLRRGLATEAARAGISERLIMNHGRWKSREVMTGYIERGKIWEENPLMKWLT